MPTKVEYVKAMGEMARESERSYRAMIEAYNAEIELRVRALPRPDGSAVVPSARGVYKARLFGALFMAMAFGKSAHSEEDTLEMINLATGIALESLQGQGDVRLDRKEARSFALPYATSLWKAMIAAFRRGPCLPELEKREQLAVAEHLHDAVAESFRAEGYTREVRERFDVWIRSNTAAAMNHAARWMANVNRSCVGQPRMFALLSALMSFVYLASFPALLILLFFNWKIAIGLIPVGIGAAFLAQWLNGLKLRELYGREAAALLNELDWASGRRPGL